MTVNQIATRLNNELSLLTLGNRVALPRQQTLRATLDWSYALLSQAERLLLGRVSVFSGGWTLEAAEGVCRWSGTDMPETQVRLRLAGALWLFWKVAALQGDYTTARTQVAGSLLLCQELGDKRGIVLALEDLAGVLIAEKQSARAVCLLGAAQALRKDIGLPLSPTEQDHVDRQIVHVRTALDTAAFMESWDVGSAVTLEQAIGCALSE